MYDRLISYQSTILNRYAIYLKSILSENYKNIKDQATLN